MVSGYQMPGEDGIMLLRASGNKVFHNLLENSPRHGKGVSEISLINRMRGKAPIIYCRYNGVGIPEGMKEEVFRYRGMGKGLYLASEVCERGIGVHGHEHRRDR